MSDLKLWEFIKNEISEYNEVALSVVAGSSDSSPGRQGFKMGFSKTGKQFGTVGGGALELKIIKLITEGFQSGKRSFVNVLHHDPVSEGEKSGLICGGTQTVITYFLNESDLELVNKIIDSFEKGNRIILTITQNGIRISGNVETVDRYKFQIENINDYEYSEIYGVTDTVYVIGGGHVGLAVSRIMSSLDFYVVTIDNREDVFTMNQNVYADRKIICNFEDAGKHVREGEMSYVVIVTPMHKSDKDALKSVINKNLKYIGMMGSKRKIQTVFDNLISEGIDPEKLKTVHTPIGLEIYAKTPEEIAISIAAEIINVKNKTSNVV